MFGQDFGHRLRELRLAQGLTKEKFCEGDEVLSVRQLTRIETGKSQPKLETLEHLARRLNISLSELLGERAVGSKLPVEYLMPSFSNILPFLCNRSLEEEIGMFISW